MSTAGGKELLPGPQCSVVTHSTRKLSAQIVKGRRTTTCFQVGSFPLVARIVANTQSQVSRICAKQLHSRKVVALTVAHTYSRGT